MADRVEFNESSARAAAREWAAIGTEAAAIATDAHAITDKPWGDGELGSAFGPNFEDNRTAVQENGDRLADYLESFEPQITEATNLLSGQTSNLPPSG